MGEGATIRSAIVLCAGLGRRMMPLTADRPKPLVPFLGRPLIDHVIDRLVAAGVERVVVNVHYLADLMETHVRQRTDVEIVVSDERDALLDTGGGVLRAAPMLGPAPFFIHNADSVWFDPQPHEAPGARSGAIDAADEARVGAATLRDLAAAYDPARMDSLLLTCPWEQALGFDGAGDFFRDDENRLIRRGARPSAPEIFAGASILHPRTLEGLPEEPFSLNRVWNAALDQSRLFGRPMAGRWYHVGDPSALAACESDARARGFAPPADESGARLPAGGAPLS